MAVPLPHNRAVAPLDAGAAGRLAFLEDLLRCGSLVEASQLGVDFLARYGGVRQLAIAIVDRERPGGPRLVGTAAHGLDTSTVSALSILLEEREHPLVRALGSGRPITVSAGALERVRLAFSGRRCTAQALPFPDLSPAGRGDAVGLALYGGIATHPEVQWVLGLLGRRLVDLRDLSSVTSIGKHALYEELKRSSSLLEQKVHEATAELVLRNELLQRQAIELEAASSAKSQFLANMSHELRTPLNAILGYTSMMLQGVSGPPPPNLVRHLTRIDSNGRHLLTIINDILDIARIEAGKMPLNLTRFAPADLIKEVLAELEPLITRTKLCLVSEVGEDLPTLRTDRAKVKQILMNLVSNALKFTAQGAVTVSVQWNRKRSEMWLSVADTGIGISATDQETVFQDFRQVDNSPTRPYGGTGLGLAICRRLANVLDGDIRLVSVVDRGSTFTLVLPAKRIGSKGGGR